MQVYIKTLTGKSITLDIEPNDTILMVKQKIQNHQGIPPEQQTIVFNGKKLIKDNLFVADQNITAGSTLHLVLCLRKPIILFYGFQGPFTCSIHTEHPQHFVCFPKPLKNQIQWEGQIKDNYLVISGKKYPYLFWEYQNLRVDNLKPHFKFSREEIGDKVLTLVARIGLNETEASNFVTYWIGSWQKHSHWFVHVLSEEIINKLFPLQITPKPKEIKRIYLFFGAANENDQINEQFEIKDWKMTQDQTVVQWGGALHIFQDTI